MAEFTHLHVHTEYSMLDGLCRAPDLLQRSKDLGMSSLAITDHGGLYGVLGFYAEAKKLGVKPIIGVEGYVAPGSHLSKTVADKNPFHLVLLAKDVTGYRNLLALTTKAYVDGFYYRPRMDRDLLAQHRQGLVCLSACPSGEVLKALHEGNWDAARSAAGWYRELFGEDYFLEVQRHDMPEFQPAYQALVDLGREMDIPLVGTNDLHYVRQEDHYAQDVLICIQTNATIHDEKRMRMDATSFYLRSPDEMAVLFDGLPDALHNSLVIAERCNLTLDFDRVQLPEVPHPDGMSADEHLSKMCWDRLPALYDGKITPEIEDRLRYELEVIQQTQFANYFLVVEDITSFARRQGILFGPRGSAAGSIVLYALGISDIDPISKGLVFERFLNIERKEMPDIDMDFQDDRRQEVINYVTERFGRDHVAQIITFGTMGAKASIRDVGRALGTGYAQTDRVAKLIPQQLHMTIDRAIAENPELKQAMEEDPQVAQLVSTAKQLEGLTRHASTHAAGVVISRDPLIQTVPLQRPAKGDETGILMTQWDMGTVAKIGLLKMDFLGLINLQVIAKAREYISSRLGRQFEFSEVPKDDAKTFEMLSNAETSNVFQLESSGMRKHIKDLKPSTVEEITAMIALYRPGPMAHIPRYIDSKHGRVAISFPHPDLEPILRDTYGVIVYQDQVLHIVRQFAGFSLGKADIFRKAMGKKIAEVMKAQREEFRQGAIDKGYTVQQADAVFDLIEPFAGYAFNKAHSACYAELAYLTGYLKANFTSEYLAAVLSSNLGVSERVAATVAEAKRLGVEVRPPNINRSAVEFTIEDGGAIRFGLGAIKNVGEGAAQALVDAVRVSGRYTSIDDFCRRLDLRSTNKRVIESLVRAGALDELGDRGGLLESVDRLIANAQRLQKMRETGQSTMFDLFGAEVPVPQPGLDIRPVNVSGKDRLAWEKELLGIYLSEHPFAQAATDRSLSADFCGSVTEEQMNQTVLVAGMVASVRTMFTKDRRPFCSAILEDLVGTLEVTVWSEVYERTRDLWAEGNVLLVRGRVRPRDDRVQLVADEAMAYTPGVMGSQQVTEATSRFGRRVVVTIAETADATGDCQKFDDLVSLLERSIGEDPLRIVVLSGDQKVRIHLPKLPSVAYREDLVAEINQIVGSGAVTIERFEVAPAEETNGNGKNGRNGLSNGNGRSNGKGHARG